MENTYTMIGTDGQQYGPVAFEQFKAWIGEGRIGADTKVMRSDTRSWLAAAQYPELGLSRASAVSSPPQLPSSAAAAPRQYDPLLARQVQSAARWFFWIAGLSVVNLLRGGFFVVGLGIGLFVPTPLAVAAAGLFALLGFFAWKRHSWSFVVGMVLYAGDAVFFLRMQSWLGLAFHVFVLFWLFRGLRANLQLNAAANGGRM